MDTGDPSSVTSETSQDCPICMSIMGRSNDSDDSIAKLPCSHLYHNSCLTEWSETSNTCPYCRASFLEVKVLDEIDGAILRTYKVSPVSLPDPEEDEEDDGYDSIEEEIPSTRCIICGTEDHESDMMLCDSCDDSYHSFCLGHDAIPPGPFYCPTCIATDNYGSRDRCIVRTVASIRAARRPRRRTPGQRQLTTWRRAWQRVRERTWAQLNAEVEFDCPRSVLTAGQEAEIRSWRTRMERRGAPASRVVEAPETEPIEDPHTIALWRAFDKASATLRQSKSSSPQSPPTPPPSDPSPSTQRKQKRPIRRATIDDQPVKRTKVEGPSYLTSLLDSIRTPQQHPVIISTSPPSGPSRSPSPVPTKSDIAAHVAQQLNPYYKTIISRDEYTTLNRTITRSVYDLLSRNPESNIDALIKAELTQYIDPTITS